MNVNHQGIQEDRETQATLCRNTLKSETGSLGFCWHQTVTKEDKNKGNFKATLHVLYREANPMRLREKYIDYKIYLHLNQYLKVSMKIFSVIDK